MEILREEPKSGKIVFNKKDKCFYLIVGYKKQEIEEEIAKASIMTKDNVFSLVMKHLPDMYCMRIMQTYLVHMSDEVLVLQDEDAVLLKLIKRLQFLLKESIRTKEKEFVPLNTLDYVIVASRVKPTLLRKFVKGFYITEEDLRTKLNKNYATLHENLPIATDLKVREVYCFRGLKIARFYMYLGNSYLYHITRCPNEISDIQSIYKMLQKDVSDNNKIFMHMKDIGYIRGLYNKGTRMTLYDTGLRYNAVYMSDNKAERIQSALGLKNEDMKLLIGA